MPSNVLDLPIELLIRILSFCALKDLVSCQRVNWAFHDVIRDSAFLQYKMALEAAGFIDNPDSAVDVTERHRLLKFREKCWSTFSPSSRTVIQVAQPSSIFEVAHGALLLGEDDEGDETIVLPATRSLRYICPPSRLHSGPSPTLNWTQIGRDHGIGGDTTTVLRTRMSIEEHGLVAVATLLV